MNLLREKLETTRIQGQRDLREYRRLLNNDEKLNIFLEMKNQQRPCVEISTRINAQQIGDDHMTIKVVEEWRAALVSQCGHCNFGEIVQQVFKLNNSKNRWLMLPYFFLCCPTVSAQFGTGICHVWFDCAKEYRNR